MKYAFMKRHRGQHSIRRMSEVLGVSRSGYYAWITREPSNRALANQTLLARIKQIHKEVMETYGSPRMHVELLESGMSVSLGRVERLMRQNSIQAKQSKRHKQTQQHRTSQPAADNILNRKFDAVAPNEKWVSDITFIETREGWLYLAIILDIYSRAIVGWSMSNKINGELVHSALNMAIEQRAIADPVLVHSDQGSQYTATSYRNKLNAHGMICSMSRKGKCHDNAVAESFFHTLKNELVHDKMYNTRAEAKQSIFKYIELFYNRKRRHSSVGYKAPFEYEMITAVA